MHDRATPPRDGSESVPTPLRYRAFISYSHADSKWASWLMRRLEGYRVPERFHGRAAPIGEVGARLAPVFRDRDELATTSDLGEAVRAALRESATLAVVCSPSAAKSRWVREEVVAFKRLHGETRVFAFIIAGEPKAEGTDEDCFSPALRRELGADGELSSVPAEVVAADARPHADGKDGAFIRLVAGLLGVGFDDLRQRELHRRHRRMTWIAVGATAGMAIMIGLAAAAHMARNDAQRRQGNVEEWIAGMLNDMKDGLAKADRLDALDAAGARLTGYFQALNPRDLTDRTLTQQAKALNQIGEIRLSQLRYPEAEAAFGAAYQRTAALAERQPGDGAVLFERAQAEFWIGNVHYKRGNYGPAGEWLTRYRDSSVELAGRDPANLAWQREAVSGYHNLAVLELDRGNLAAAREGFLGERAVLEKMSEANPGEVLLKFSLANVDSFLGTTAERSGDFREASDCFARQIARLDQLLATDPKNTRWQRRRADALALQSDIMAISGGRGEALVQRRVAVGLFEGLVAQDATNGELRHALLNARFKEAQLLHAAGDSAGAARGVRAVRPELEQLVKAEPSNQKGIASLALCQCFHAQLLDAAGEAGAPELAEQALAAGQSLLEQNRASDVHRGAYASARVVSGAIALRAGHAELARQHWEGALEAIDARGLGTKHWRLLDPAARAMALLGRHQESRVLVERLRALGYQPLEPWP